MDFVRNDNKNQVVERCVSYRNAVSDGAAGIIFSSLVVVLCILGIRVDGKSRVEEMKKWIGCGSL